MEAKEIAVSTGEVLKGQWAFSLSSAMLVTNLPFVTRWSFGPANVVDDLLDGRLESAGIERLQETQSTSGGSIEDEGGSSN